MMRRIIINVVAFSVLGWLLNTMGYGIGTWQYWGCMGLALVLNVNLMI